MSTKKAKSKKAATAEATQAAEANGARSKSTTDATKAIAALHETRALLDVLAHVREPREMPIQAYVEEIAKHVDISHVVVKAGVVTLALPNMNSEALERIRQSLTTLEEIEQNHDLGKKNLRLVFVRNNYKNDYAENEQEGDNKITIDGEVLVVRSDDLSKFASFSARGDIVVNVRSGYGGIRFVNRKNVALYFDGEPLWKDFEDMAVHGEDPEGTIDKKALKDVASTLSNLVPDAEGITLQWVAGLVQAVALLFAPEPTPNEGYGS